MIEEEKFEFEILNIKLQTKKVGEAKRDAYVKLITDLKKRRIHTPVAENKHVMVFSYTKRKTPSGKVKFLYGKVAKGYYFGDSESTTLDIANATTNNERGDSSKIRHADQTDYIFIPEAHRFLVLLGNKINGGDMLKFFRAALEEVKDPDDVVRVEIVNEPSIIKELLSKRTQIEKINYVVTYTNDDVLGATGRQFDQRLKNSNIGKIEVKAEADNKSFLNIEGEELLEGGIRLAEQNGEVKNAVVRENGKRKYLSSKEKPRKLEFRSNWELFRTLAANLILKENRATEENANE